MDKVPIKVNVNEIANQSKIIYFINNLPKDNTYFFSITSIDSKNEESDFSNEAHIYGELFNHSLNIKSL